MNVSKYEFLTVKDVLPEEDLPEKALTMKRFEYLPLGSELKKQTSIAEVLQLVLQLYSPWVGHTVSAVDSFACCGSIRYLEKVKLSENS